MNIILCIPKGRFQDTAAVLEFIYPFINFPLLGINTFISYNGGPHLFDYDEAVALLKKNGDLSLRLTDELSEGEESNRFVYRKDPSKFVDVLNFSISRRENIQLDELVAGLVKYDLTTACIFDFSKAKWQSEEFIANYEYHKRPHDHLKKITYPNMPPILRTRIDVFQNPGHETLTYTMSLMAAPEMWFGPGSLKYFDKERLLSFPDAKRIQRLPDGVIHIELFDWETPDYEAREILDLQRHFRDWVKMDEIELMLNEVIKQKTK